MRHTPGKEQYRREPLLLLMSPNKVGGWGDNTHAAVWRKRKGRGEDPRNKMEVKKKQGCLLMLVVETPPSHICLLLGCHSQHHLPPPWTGCLPMEGLPGIALREWGRAHAGLGGAGAHAVRSAVLQFPVHVRTPGQQSPLGEKCGASIPEPLGAYHSSAQRTARATP